MNILFLTIIIIVLVFVILNRIANKANLERKKRIEQEKIESERYYQNHIKDLKRKIKEEEETEIERKKNTYGTWNFYEDPSKWRHESLFDYEERIEEEQSKERIIADAKKKEKEKKEKAFKEELLRIEKKRIDEKAWAEELLKMKKNNTSKNQSFEDNDKRYKRCANCNDWHNAKYNLCAVCNGKVDKYEDYYDIEPD